MQSPWHMEPRHNAHPQEYYPINRAGIHILFSPCSFGTAGRWKRPPGCLPPPARHARRLVPGLFSRILGNVVERMPHGAPDDPTARQWRRAARVGRYSEERTMLLSLAQVRGDVLAKRLVPPGVINRAIQYLSTGIRRESSHASGCLRVIEGIAGGYALLLDRSMPR